MADRSANTHLLVAFEPDGGASANTSLLVTFEPDGGSSANTSLLVAFEPEGIAIGTTGLLVEFGLPVGGNKGLSGHFSARRPLLGSFANRRR